MNRYTLEEFVQNTQQEDKGEGVFELETSRLLEINLTDTIWAKTGSMVSYRGKIKFEREGVFEHGVSKMFKKMLSGEGTSLMKATGDGKLYVADQGKKISILRLAQGDSIFVNGNDLLAFEPSVRWDIKLMKKCRACLQAVYLMSN